MKEEWVRGEEVLRGNQRGPAKWRRGCERVEHCGSAWSLGGEKGRKERWRERVENGGGALCGQG